MLAAIITIIILGGGGFDLSALKSYVKKNVEDSERVTQVNSIIKDANAEIKAYNKQIRKDWAERLIDVNRNYDAEREDFYRLFAEVDAGRNDMQSKLLAQRFKMKEQITRDEWQAIFSQLAETRAAGQ